MSDSTGTLWRILSEDTPVAVVFYQSPSAREEILELATILAPAERQYRRTANVHDAFSEEDMILFLTPEDEQRAVLTLDGRREALRNRTAPVVLFLMSGGDGEKRLRNDAAGLESWLRGMEYDPERLAPIDVEAERARFAEKTGLLPEDWLIRWRGGSIADTTENNFLSHHAALLEQKV
ncbi:MAG: hypothetical protein ABJE95_14250 [Byssovorax sp.]